MSRAAKPVQLSTGHWRIRWRDASGKQLSEVHVTHNAAKAALAVHQVEVRSVVAGLIAAPPPKKTFADLTTSWLETRAHHKRSKDADVSRLKAHLTPAFGKAALKDISYARIEQFKAERSHLAKQTLRHHLILLGSMLKHAHRLGWLAILPPIDKPRVHAVSLDFSHLGSGEEIQRFLRAARAHGDEPFTMYATAIYTGMRQGELAALRWDHINWERRVITVDRSFHGPTKSDAVRHVPILDPLLPILRAWRLRRPGELVFCSSHGTMYQPKDRIFSEHFHKVLDAAEFARPVEGRRVQYIRFHDLRHTFASQWAMNGGDMFKLQKILGHKDMAMTLRYSYLTPDAFASDFGRFIGLVVDEPAMVTQLPTRRTKEDAGR